MGLEPTGAVAHFDDDGDGEGEGGAHDAADEIGERFEFLGGEFEEEFVVDLEDHAGAEAGGAEFAVHVDHGELDHVCGGALDGSVDGGAFGGFADGGVGAGDVAERAAAAGEGADPAAGSGVGDGLIHVIFDAGVLDEVFVDEAGAFWSGDAETLGEAEGADAEDDAEVDHFGGAAHVLRDLVIGDAEDACGGGGVDVSAHVEGVDHGWVAAEGGHDAEFDLAVVGAEEDHVRGGWDEGLADGASLFAADGDILEVRVIGSETAGAGAGLEERGVDAAGAA